MGSSSAFAGAWRSKVHEGVTLGQARGFDVANNVFNFFPAKVCDLKRKRKSGKNPWQALGVRNFRKARSPVLGRDSFRVVDKRVRFAGFRGKWLQAAVVASMHGPVRERVLRR